MFVGRPGLITESVHASSERLRTEVPQWGVYEVTLTNEGSYTASEKYREVRLEATFRGPEGRSITVPGFWDGGNTFKVRFAPPAVGSWSYETRSSEGSLDGKTGTFEAVAPSDQQVQANPNYRGFLEVSANGRHLRYADGTPFLYAAGTAWNLNSPAMSFRDGEVQQYVDDRAAKGFTAIQFRPGAPGDDRLKDAQTVGRNEGGWLFERTPQEINPANLRWLDKRVEYIHQAGQVPVIFFHWGGTFGGLDIADLKPYYRHIIARYQAYNVIWSVSGEFSRDNNEYPEEPRAAGQFIDQVDGQEHLTTIHPWPTRISTRYYTGEEWLDFHMQQTYDRRDNYPVLAKEYNANDGPVINGEPMGTGPFTELEYRRDYWTIAASGMAGGWALLTPMSTGRRSVAEWVDKPGAQLMEVAIEYISSIEWWKLRPDQGIIRSGLKDGQNDGDNRGGVASYMSDGTLALVYYPRNSQATIDLSRISASAEARLRWLNTADGTVREGETYSTDATPSLSPPSGWDDALLVIEAVDAQPPADEFILHGNYPNPFTSSTTIRFDLPEAATVGVELFTATGRRVLSLAGRDMEAGPDRTIDINTPHLPSGMYIYELTARMESATRVSRGQMLLAR